MHDTKKLCFFFLGKFDSPQKISHEIFSYLVLQVQVIAEIRKNKNNSNQKLNYLRKYD